MDEKTDREKYPPKAFKTNERFSGGVLLLIAGGALLARQLGAPLPAWLFTWPMILILVGLFIGLQLQFRNPAWLIPTGIGAFFLADRMLPDINLVPFIFPVVVIAAGLFFMLRPRRWQGMNCSGSNRNFTLDNRAEITDDASSFADRGDVLDITAIFGGVKKNVLSKHFKGGEVVAIMGGTEINLSQTDFNGRIKIETFNMFGGTKLIIPAHWDVQSEVVAIFGGVDDKRRLNGAALDPTKVVVLDGTCVFGGIEISSY